MKQRPRVIKDKKVRAFEAIVRTVWGFERTFKRYIHSEESNGLWAYVRQLNQAEQLKARSVQSNQNLQLVMNYSPKLTTDLFLEFGNSTYKVVSVDPFEFNRTDLELRAEETSPPTFDEVEYDEY